jgi:hypothetical protein
MNKDKVVISSKGEYVLRGYDKLICHPAYSSAAEDQDGWQGNTYKTAAVRIYVVYSALHVRLMIYM